MLSSELTPLQTIHKAFEKAFDNGFVLPIGRPIYWRISLEVDNLKSTIVIIEVTDDFGHNPRVFRQSLESLLFDKKFAQAIWSECTDTMTVKNNSLNVSQVIDMNGWRYHIQQLAIAADRITYLREHL